MDKMTPAQAAIENLRTILVPSRYSKKSTIVSISSDDAELILATIEGMEAQRDNQKDLLQQQINWREIVQQKAFELKQEKEWFECQCAAKDAQLAAMRASCEEIVALRDHGADGYNDTEMLNNAILWGERALSTTAGAPLLAVVRAAEEVFRKTSLARCKPEICGSCNEDKARIGCRLQGLGKALAAYRGGGNR